jgi:hypothetical protein
MSDVDLLFLVLAFIYAWECACWTPRGSVGFRSWLGREWRPVHPSAILGNQRGGFVFGMPLPPLGTLLMGTQFPVSLSSNAMLAHVASSVNPGWRAMQTGKWFCFDDIRTVQARGKKVLVNGELFVKTGSPTFAEHLAKELERVSKLPVEKRGSAIREIFSDTLDCKSIERVWQEFKEPSRRLRLLTNAVFGYLFLLAPILIWNFGFLRVWLGLLIGLLGLTITTAILFHRAHKKFFPSAEDDRFTHVMTVLLSPATTVRAHDPLSRPLLERFHPLAIAKVFCSPERFRDFARGVLREVRYPGLPLCPSSEISAQRAEQFSRELLLKEIEAFLKKNGLEPDELLPAPARAEAGCVAYCPRCLAQFTTPAGACADCGGLPLLALPNDETVAAN